MQSHSNGLQNFYKQVFEQFKDRLFLAYRFRSSIKSEQLDKFTQKVQKKLEKAKRKQIFQIGLKMALQKKSNKNQEEDQVKLEEDQKDYQVHKNQQEKQHEINNHVSESESSDEDDLNKFKPKESKEKKDTPLNHEKSEVKIQEKQEKVQQQQQNQEQQQEQEYRKREQILSKRQSIISAHIIGTYSTRTKKYIPKDERTKIELQNVFIRNYDKEYYYSKISCEFNQTQYANIKL